MLPNASITILCMKQAVVAIGDSVTLGRSDPDGGWLGRIRHESERRVIETAMRQYRAVYSKPGCGFDVRTAFVWGFGEKEVGFIDGV